MTRPETTLLVAGTDSSAHPTSRTHSMAETDPCQSLVDLPAGSAIDMVAVLLPRRTRALAAADGAPTAPGAVQWTALPLRLTAHDGTLDERHVKAGWPIVEVRAPADESANGPDITALAPLRRGTVVRIQHGACTAGDARAQGPGGDALRVRFRYGTPVDFLGAHEPSNVKLNALWGLRYLDQASRIDHPRVKTLLRRLLHDRDDRVAREARDLLDGPFGHA